MVELLRLFPNAEAPPPSDYAALQWWFPKLPHGLSDLLGLRYLLVLGPPSPAALFSAGGCRIHESASALPRPFFAQRRELGTD